MDDRRCEDGRGCVAVPRWTVTTANGTKAMCEFHTRWWRFSSIAEVRPLPDPEAAA